MSESPLLTVKQVGERLQVHEKTVSLWLRDGQLAGIKLGAGRNAEWRIDPADLKRFIDERRAKPNG